MKHAAAGVILLLAAGTAQSGDAPFDPGLAVEVLVLSESIRHNTRTSQRWAATARLEALADEAVPGAASVLAELIVDGLVDSPLSSARKWARIGHERGELESTLALATMLAEGVGGEADIVAAAPLALEAADAGSPAAAVLVYDILGRDDPAAAVEYLERAAASGYGRAQLLLGLHYAVGDQAPQSTEKALFWLFLADAVGEARAERWLDPLITTLGPEKTLQILKATLEWSPQ